jgi:asparagine synthase (glutamine-hydrolysing)
MCGIAGLWTADGTPHDPLEALVDRMRDSVSHRGPDGAGTWVDARRGIGLGHRRLAIQDLSPLGRQPMVSKSDRYVLTFNGEVYNFVELRRELEARGATFRGHSDTEVMLAAFEAWGVVPAVQRFVGMFAFALWDAEERRLWLARDRLGIKPLYAARIGKTLAFGSELKALLAVPGFDRRVDRSVLAAYLRYNCVPGRKAIWQGVQHLLPGTLLEYRDPEREPVEHTFWSAEQVAREGLSEPLRSSEQDSLDLLEQTLSDAVRLRMLSDVPLGAFLSGGIDSSTVVALMQKQSSRPVRTFSIGYREAAYDESVHARAVANHLGTDHTELYVTSQDALDVIPSLPELYDEPFSDSSQIPTHLVSKLARAHVTVALSGDGGDELFGGYNRHLWAPRLWKRLGRIPSPVRRMLGRSLRSVPPWATDALMDRAGPALPRRLRLRVPGEKLQKLGRVLGATSEAALYRALCSHQDDPGQLLEGQVPEALSERAALEGGALPFSEAMMLLDLRTYLPDDILTKVDRASMAVALEARVPILDHRVVALAWRLPQQMKIRDGVTKWALRQVLYRHVPQALVDREKSGFGVPIDQWLRGPLREWADALLEPSRLRQEGYLRPEPVRALWSAHLSGRHNHHHQLWDVLMFQAWLERWGQVSA